MKIRQKIFFNYHQMRILSLLLYFQHSDMNDEMRTEAMELCVTACEKFASNNEVSLNLHEPGH